METDVISNSPDIPENSNNNSNMWKYIIIFVILAIFGFNLFSYVGTFSNFIGKITDRIVDFFRPILAYFGYGISETAKKTIDLTASGSKKVIDVTAGTLTGGLNVLQKGLDKGKGKGIGKGIGKGMGTNGMGMGNGMRKNKDIMPLPDDAGSLIQASKVSKKAGYCYIGEDRGFRSCISVGEGDTCMSGDIFPSRELCINPNLRDG
uniref:Uncharacterized protein n=1 Tax=viral metagenome TaxID=1070528 RepID=A0A6C0IKK4_9ZZZZ